MQSKLGKWGLCSEDETYRLKSDNMQIYSKESLIQKLEELANKGWIKNERKGNDGAVGNTLEDYLGITENNLPIPNAAEWELKAHRSTSTALITLLHLEPSPQGLSLVSNMLLPKYGWKHQKAGIKYPESEMSFRQTITCPRCSDRGFRVVINRDEKKVEISFDSSCIDERKHAEWKSQVNERVGLNELNPQPYWGFSDLEHAIGAKLHNCFYVVADVKSENGKLLAYLRIKDENILATTVHLRIWQQDNNPIGELTHYTEREQDLLNQLEQGTLVTLNGYCRQTGISRRFAEHLLAKFIRYDIVEPVFKNHKFYFQIKK